VTAALKVWCGEVDTVVAEDLVDVRRVLVEQYGESEEISMMMEDGFAEVSPDRELTILDGDNLSAKRTQTAARWAAENGRGLLCSSEY
jgi:hypothetical protein